MAVADARSAWALSMTSFGSPELPDVRTQTGSVSAAVSHPATRDSISRGLPVSGRSPTSDPGTRSPYSGRRNPKGEDEPMDSARTASRTAVLVCQGQAAAVGRFADPTAIRLL